MCRRTIKTLQSSLVGASVSQSSLQVDVRYGRQRYHGVGVPAESAASLGRLGERLSDLFLIKKDRLTIIHRGKVLADPHSPVPSLLASDGSARPQLQLLGEPQPLHHGEPQAASSSSCVLS